MLRLGAPSGQNDDTRPKCEMTFGSCEFELLGSPRTQRMEISSFQRSGHSFVAAPFEFILANAHDLSAQDQIIGINRVN